MVDTFSSHTDSVTSPVSNAFVITPDDASDLSFVTRGLYVSASADVVVDMNDSGTVTLHNLAPGMLHPLRIRRVYQTGTTPGITIIGAY